ncbi:transposase Tn7-like proteinA (plasmid) [Cupriavidus metallidurans CH34]|uniref:Transposase Tn7-like proteinA n=1 Tax=Cupriavidus metallidurans (strain ATCC 43123 / DSM 2839 / NBRC 102507 / CH34) TaxID=266264 RepID=Q1LC08_CUPMC|nr:transposase Tn7-like proteinA [Cupriavidus metallidurans CH34]
MHATKASPGFEQLSELDLTKKSQDLSAVAKRLLNPAVSGRAKGKEVIRTRKAGVWSPFEMNPQKLERFLREGRGMGSGNAYRPWIQVNDFSSLGRVHRTSSALTGYRTHHLLSDNEYYAYLEAWWDEEMLDIREQYPLLPVALTCGIAAELGFRHPYSTKYRLAIPLTTDLLLVRKRGLEAVAVVEDAHYEEQRTEEKLAIAEEFWRRRGVPTRVALSSTLKVQRSRNLHWIYQARRAPTERPYAPGANPLHDCLVGQVEGGPMSFWELAFRADLALCLPMGTSIAAIRWLLAERVLSTDIDDGDITKDCEIFVRSK